MLHVMVCSAAASAFFDLASRFHADSVYSCLPTGIGVRTDRTISGPGLWTGSTTGSTL